MFKLKNTSFFGYVTVSLKDQRRLSKGCCSFHVEGSSPSTWSEATTQVPSASQEYVPLSSADTRLMFKRATFQSCSTTTLRPSGCNGCPSFFHWAFTGLEYWQMNSAGWFSSTRRSSISLTTSTVGSEVGVRGHTVRALSITYKDKNRTCRLTCGLYNPPSKIIKKWCLCVWNYCFWGLNSIICMHNTTTWSVLTIILVFILVYEVFFF